MQTLSVEQLVGRTLEEYQIERLLGYSQLGAAFLARQRSQGRLVMITAFNFPEGISTQEHDRITTHFAQEKATLLRLTHPHILPMYDFGEQSGYLYLVTAFVQGASLRQVFQQQGRLTPHQTLDVLKQLAAGLDYAHSHGAVHGLLSLSTVLISHEFPVQLAGFGLRTMLEVLGIRQHTSPQAYLFSTSGTLMGNPESVSPERVLGKPVDARSDIYALGVMLFELLSGRPPFRGATPLETALQRIQQPVPWIHAVCPDVPEALDLVISKTLDRDPEKRYQCAGDSVAAFEHVLTLLEAVERSSTPQAQQLTQDPQLTLPPTVNWFEEAGMPSGKWQLMPPIVTGHMPVFTSSPSIQKTAQDGVGSGQMKHPGAATQPDSPTELLPAKEAFPPPAESRPDSLAGIDPLAWWSATSPRPGTPPAAPGTFTQRSPVRIASSKPHSRRRPAQQDRRKFVKLMAVGTAGVLTASGISFAHFIQSLKQSPSQIANAPTTGSIAPATTQGYTPTAGPTSTTKGAQKTPTPSKSPTAKPSSSATKAPQPSPTSQPTQQPTSQPTQPPTPQPTQPPTQPPTPTPTQPPTPQPTQPPTPTPTPPSHTGTVIGSTNQAKNSAKSFTNPKDGLASWLVHMSNGNFVAVEQACTHAGVAVNYNASTGQFNCPAHGAIFNADGTHPQTPATRPLPPVHITVNADGTITTP